MGHGKNVINQKLFSAYCFVYHRGIGRLICNEQVHPVYILFMTIISETKWFHVHFFALQCVCATYVYSTWKNLQKSFLKEKYQWGVMWWDLLTMWVIFVVWRRKYPIHLDKILQVNPINRTIHRAWNVWENSHKDFLFVFYSYFFSFFLALLSLKYYIYCSRSLSFSCKITMTS